MPAPGSAVYKPPPGLTDVYPVDLGEGLSLTVRVVTYRNLIVDFAIMTYLEDSDGRHPLARTDCCWGAVHRHRYNRAGEDEIDHQPVHTIVLDQTQWEQVNDCFLTCYDNALAEAPEQARRWKNEC